VWQRAAGRLSEFIQKGRVAAGTEKNPVLTNSCEKAMALTRKEAGGLFSGRDSVWWLPLH